MRCMRRDAAKIGVIINDRLPSPVTTYTAFIDIAICMAPRRTGRLATDIYGG